MTPHQIQVNHTIDLFSAELGRVKHILSQQEIDHYAGYIEKCIELNELEAFDENSEWNSTHNVRYSENSIKGTHNEMLAIAITNCNPDSRARYGLGTGNKDDELSGHDLIRMEGDTIRGVQVKSVFSVYEFNMYKQHVAYLFSSNPPTFITFVDQKHKRLIELGFLEYAWYYNELQGDSKLFLPRTFSSAFQKAHEFRPYYEIKELHLAKPERKRITKEMMFKL